MHRDDGSGSDLVEIVQAAWLLYYDDDSGDKEAKATIALEGMRARATTVRKLRERYDDCFEIFHERRRTYYLRPLGTSRHGVSEQTGAQWIRTINAAIDTIGNTFESRFRRVK
jgi:hypothetical protein